MNENYETEELNLKREERLVSTLITQKPPRTALPVALMTLAIMGVVSLFYWSDSMGWSDQLPAVKRNILGGEWWRLITAIFIHADLGHFLSNMYMLGIFCFFIYAYFGFKLYPLWSLVAAALTNLFAILTYEPDVRLLGASGLVYVLGGTWLTLYFLIQRQYHLGGRLLRVVGIGALIFFPTSFVPTTSYRTHFIGFVFGVAMGAIFFYKNKAWIRSKESYRVNFV